MAHTAGSPEDKLAQKIILIHRFTKRLEQGTATLNQKAKFCRFLVESFPGTEVNEVDLDLELVESYYVKLVDELSARLGKEDHDGVVDQIDGKWTLIWIPRKKSEPQNQIRHADQPLFVSKGHSAEPETSPAAAHPAPIDPEPSSVVDSGYNIDQEPAQMAANPRMIPAESGSKNWWGQVAAIATVIAAMGGIASLVVVSFSAIKGNAYDQGVLESRVAELGNAIDKQVISLDQKIESRLKLLGESFDKQIATQIQSIGGQVKSVETNLSDKIGSTEDTWERVLDEAKTSYMVVVETKTDAIAKDVASIKVKLDDVDSDVGELGGSLAGITSSLSKVDRQMKLIWKKLNEGEVSVSPNSTIHEVGLQPGDVVYEGSFDLPSERR